ncbi:NAD(P)H-dependent glycerol-3-phosphate dehydrogenase [Candidatus Albibeggiatoa sp. nov. NOAA]|uniref:NAD(P)H-dependent glycerol-3-phosphate dehydrogenase n=1 Tax=Candidatus Albibeggiatoa sp. nov. NOAA TaxID=3162724 RepID=UPI00330141A7|nr:NAD(P)-dependent glycerol-3-phosphate dehydrogenase [Thiotrichaceae bacterium]
MSVDSPILVLGAGSWGTALALVLARNGHSIWLWSHEQPHVDQMRAERQNNQFLPDYPFPDNIELVDDLACATKTQQILIVVPSHAFHATLSRIQPYLQPNTQICWATKGFEYKTGLLLHEVAHNVLGQQAFSVLSGPSFAKEVAKQLPTAVTIASDIQENAQFWVNAFHDPYFRPYLSSDLIGVQIGGAVKNVMAIAAGIADGLGFGANTRAALITRGSAEMLRLGIAMGGQAETFMGLAGMGDLVLTCTDNQSRNRRFGFALAQSQKTHDEILAEIGQVVEGIHAAREVSHLAQKYQVDMPIVDHVQQVLTQQITPKQAVQSLLSREVTTE